MPEMPVFCEKCGLIFGSGLYFENTTNVTLSGNRAECPRCHNMAAIPDGLFNFLNDTIEIIKAPKITVTKLEYYRNLVGKLKEEKADFEEVKSELNENAPELSKLIDFLPKTRSELYTFLALILATITFTLNQLNKNEDKTNITNEINVYNVIEYYNMNYTKTDDSVINSKPIKKRKVGRNDPCFCGSKLKFKKCHGKYL